MAKTNPEVDGLLNLWDLLHFCTLQPMTTAELITTLGVTEASTRRLRKRAADRYQVDLNQVEVEREGRKVPAFSLDDWNWREPLSARFEALGA